MISLQCLLDECALLKTVTRVKAQSQGRMAYPVFRCEPLDMEACALMEVPNRTCEHFKVKNGDGYAGR